MSEAPEVLTPERIAEMAFFYLNRSERSEVIQAMTKYPTRVISLLLAQQGGRGFHDEREVALMVLRIARQAMQGGEA